MIKIILTINHRHRRCVTS